MKLSSLVKLMFSFKIILFLIILFIIYKFVSLLLQWKKHKILMIPKVIFVIICFIIGIKGFTTVSSIKNNAQHKQVEIIKGKDAIKRDYSKEGAEYIAKKTGNKVKNTSQNLYNKAKNKYNHFSNSPTNQKMTQSLRNKYNQSEQKIKDLQKKKIINSSN